MIESGIEASWKEKLKEEFTKDYFIKLNNFIASEKSNQIIYPPEKLIFSAFNYTPFEEVKIVILGQDPYHGLGQANGLSFSVNDGVKFPPSLSNIFKELRTDCDCAIPLTGNLEHWAAQGVFLLNATLTVRAQTPGSHQNRGWEQFTAAVIKLISENKKNVVFLLWGNYAKAKANLIDTEKHLILQAAHPSPLARGAFFGSRHFSKANEYLKANKIKPVDWCL